MKKIVAFVIVLVLALVLSGCLEKQEKRCGVCGSTKDLYRVPTTSGSICKKCMLSPGK